MIEVNYQCMQCRPFTSEAPCATCLESQLQFSKLKLLKLKDGLGEPIEDGHSDKRDDVFSLFSEEDLATADDLAA